MARRKKDSGALKVHETMLIEPVAPATEVRVSGPETDFVVRANQGTLIHTYGSADQHMGGGIEWSFAEPGEYTLRHMDAAGVEYSVETVTVE